MGGKERLSGRVKDGTIIVNMTPHHHTQTHTCMYLLYSNPIQPLMYYTFIHSLYHGLLPYHVHTL